MKLSLLVIFTILFSINAFSQSYLEEVKERAQSHTRFVEYTQYIDSVERNNFYMSMLSIVNVEFQSELGKSFESAEARSEFLSKYGHVVQYLIMDLKSGEFYRAAQAAETLGALGLTQKEFSDLLLPKNRVKELTSFKFGEYQLEVVRWELNRLLLEPDVKEFVLRDAESTGQELIREINEFVRDSGLTQVVKNIIKGIDIFNGRSQRVSLFYETLVSSRQAERYKRYNYRTYPTEILPEEQRRTQLTEQDLERSFVRLIAKTLDNKGSASESFLEHNLPKNFKDVYDIERAITSAKVLDRLYVTGDVYHLDRLTAYTEMDPKSLEAELREPFKQLQKEAYVALATQVGKEANQLSEAQRLFMMDWSLSEKKKNVDKESVRNVNFRLFADLQNKTTLTNAELRFATDFIYKLYLSQSNETQRMTLLRAHIDYLNQRIENKYLQNYSKDTLTKIFQLFAIPEVVRYMVDGKTRSMFVPLLDYAPAVIKVPSYHHINIISDAGVNMSVLRNHTGADQVGAVLGMLGVKQSLLYDAGMQMELAKILGELHFDIPIQRVQLQNLVEFIKHIAEEKRMQVNLFNALEKWLSLFRSYSHSPDKIKEMAFERLDYAYRASIEHIDTNTMLRVTDLDYHNSRLSDAQKVDILIRAAKANPASIEINDRLLKMHEQFGNLFTDRYDMVQEQLLKALNEAQLTTEQVQEFKKMLRADSPFAQRAIYKIFREQTGYENLIRHYSKGEALLFDLVYDESTLLMERSYLQGLVEKMTNGTVEERRQGFLEVFKYVNGKTRSINTMDVMWDPSDFKTVLVEQLRPGVNQILKDGPFALSEAEVKKYGANFFEKTFDVIQKLRLVDSSVSVDTMLNWTKRFVEGNSSQSSVRDILSAVMRYGNNPLGLQAPVQDAHRINGAVQVAMMLSYHGTEDERQRVAERIYELTKSTTEIVRKATERFMAQFLSYNRGRDSAHWLLERAYAEGLKAPMVKSDMRTLINIIPVEYKKMQCKRVFGGN